MYRETQVEHFEPLLVKSRPVVVACCAATAALIVIAWAMVGAADIRIALSASITITVTSSFALGDSRRLRDLRQRRARALRNHSENSGEMAKLAPLAMIQFRFRLCGAATAAGSLSLAATTVVGFLGDYEPGAGEWSLVISILTVVVSTLSAVAATYTRPLD
jgi:hypothetical protein